MAEIIPFRMLRARAVAEMLGVSESWLEQIRLKGGGPPYFKFGKSVRYRIEDVEAWVAAQRRVSTSEAA